MIDRNKHTKSASDTELIKQIQRLQQYLKTYEELTEKIRTATVIDRSIYDGEQDQEWLSIHREDYAQMMAILAKLDLCNPWNQIIQPRMTK
ncbi:hypothetical protein [Bacillus benzoevorans]|uniref:L-rhamnose mutarotase n=1 Tax=Bacillus benzoevorans TaxID=1456 RepID=A0A7X0LW09_9BACI|nr:hypothetical protein [Bacillus benzoevorans]MBB6446576.1 L-rhamnose mutarotase [Bacillus benzoevorans]